MYVDKDVWAGGRRRKKEKTQKNGERRKLAEVCKVSWTEFKGSLSSLDYYLMMELENSDSNLARKVEVEWVDFPSWHFFCSSSHRRWDACVERWWGVPSLYLNTSIIITFLTKQSHTRTQYKHESSSVLDPLHLGHPRLVVSTAEGLVV